MEKYFNIRYEFDREAVHRAIAERVGEGRPGYICVSDGVILETVNRDAEYARTVDGAMFSICDSSYVPLYLKSIYGICREQYCGSQIFIDIVGSRKYRMIFLGTQQAILDGLKANLAKTNPDVDTMQFVELPFCRVDEFDYASIARMVEDDGADIVWVALGAPKQEQFMQRLERHLGHGVMIAVGAAFKFYSGLEVNRAPRWMVEHHLEFVHRLWKEPRKQWTRCRRIITSLPRLYFEERRRARSGTQTSGL